MPAIATLPSNLVLSGQSNAYLTLASLPFQPSISSDLTISDLDHCVVNLLPPPNTSPAFQLTAVHIRNVSDSVLILPEMEGSALLHDLTRCTVVLGCHQVCCLSLLLQSYCYMLDNINLLRIVPNAYIYICGRLSQDPIEPYHRALLQCSIHGISVHLPLVWFSGQFFCFVLSASAHIVNARSSTQVNTCRCKISHI